MLWWFWAIIKVKGQFQDQMYEKIWKDPPQIAKVLIFYQLVQNHQQKNIWKMSYNLVSGRTTNWHKSKITAMPPMCRPHFLYITFQQIKLEKSVILLFGVFLPGKSISDDAKMLQGRNQSQRSIPTSNVWENIKWPTTNWKSIFSFTNRFRINIIKHIKNYLKSS